MKNFIQSGAVVTVAAPAAVSSGDFVAVGAICGVAQHDAASGADVSIVRQGAFTLPKTSAQAWSVGEKLYWDSGNAVVTSTASGNTLIGAAHAAAANPSSTGEVLLTGEVQSDADAFGKAAFVADASAGSAAEIDALRDALIAAGLMASS